MYLTALTAIADRALKALYKRQAIILPNTGSTNQMYVLNCVDNRSLKSITAKSAILYTTLSCHTILFTYLWICHTHLWIPHIH